MKIFLALFFTACITPGQLEVDSSENTEFLAFPQDIQFILKAQYFESIKRIDSAQLNWKKAAETSHHHLRKFALDKIQKISRSQVIIENKMQDSPPDLTLGLGMIPTNDIFLTRSVSHFCHNKPSLEWTAWRRDLSPPIARYFSALINHCSGANEESLVEFGEFYKEFSHSESYDLYAYEALSRVIQLRRANGERESVAPYFVELMRFWEQKTFLAKWFAIDPKKAYRKMTEDGLAAARHRLLIQDSESAKVYAQFTINKVKEGLTKVLDPDHNFYEALNLAKIEAYHFLAFRIALENNEFSEAKALNNIALNVPGLNLEWLTRLTTLSGFYDYFAESYEGALEIWQRQLLSTTDDSIKPMLHFWLAKVYLKLSRHDEAKFYSEKLLQEYPLSFYTTFGLTQFESDLDLSPNMWTKIFKTKKQKLGEISVLVAEVFKRLESVKDLNQPGLLNAVFDDSEEEIPILCACDSLILEKQYLHLAEFYHNNQNNQRAIMLFSKLAKEKNFWHRNASYLELNYPKTYLVDIKESARKAGLSPATVLAIIRQESSFEASAVSPASAVGLMQLIPSTAKSLSPELGFTKNLSEQLKIPRLNIELGSKYLGILNRTFQGHDFAAFAAYNAGEKTVGNWITHRQFTDVMVFIEMIPYNETRTYVKNTLRNKTVYEFFLKEKQLVIEDKTNGSAL